jgi:O-antigen/teichoic acid export membrane protein
VNNLKKVASLYNIVFGGFQHIYAIIVGVLMVPYYLNFFSIGVYGSWLAISSAVSILSALEAGLPFIITQKLASAYGNKNFYEFRQVTGSGLVFIFISSIIFLLITFFISDKLVGWVNSPLEYADDLYISIIIFGISSAIGLLSSTISSITFALQLTLIPNVGRIFSSVLSVISIIIMLNFDYGIVSIAIGYLVREIVNFFIIVIYSIKVWTEKQISSVLIELNYFKKLSRQLLFPFVGNLSDNILQKSHGFLISFFISPEVTAIYDFTSKVATMMGQFILIYTNGLFSGLSLHKSEATKKGYLKSSEKIYSYLIVMLAVALGYSYLFNQYIVGYWVGADNYGGNNLLFPIVLAICFSQIYRFLFNLQYIEGYFNNATIVQIISTFIYVTTLLILFYLGVGVFSVPLSIIFSTIIACIYLLKKLQFQQVICSDFYYKFFLKNALITTSVVIAFHFILVDYISVIMFAGMSILYLISITIFILVLNKTLRKILMNDFIFIKSLLSRNE